MQDAERVALEAAIEEIWDVAQQLGLDPFPVHFEIVPPNIMYEFGAYGLPGRFSHWTHGKAYHQIKTLYDYGLSKIYELVVNTNPAYAFLVETNSLLQNKLVVAHVLAHVDFFRHNIHFDDTNRQMIEVARAHAERIRHYEFEHGPLEVERYLDAALSIQGHVDSSLLPARRGRPGISADNSQAPRRRSRRATPYDDLFALDGQVGDPVEQPSPKVPREPDPDLLQFIMTHAPDLSEWQREILAIVRSETLYFLPQMRTKITNEGWATYWHSQILRSLELSDDEALEFASLHSAVLAPDRRSLNPYLLGLRIIEDVKRRWDDPTEDERRELHRRGGEGTSKIFEIRQLESDTSLVRNYLTADLAEELDIYLYQLKGREWKIVEKDWEQVRDRIASDLATLGQPHIVVDDADYRLGRELYLQHSYEGQELDLPYAERTLEKLHVLWGRPVHLETVQSGRAVVLCYDGKQKRVSGV